MTDEPDTVVIDMGDGVMAVGALVPESPGVAVVQATAQRPDGAYVQLLRWMPVHINTGMGIVSWYGSVEAATDAARRLGQLDIDWAMLTSYEAMMTDPHVVEQMTAWQGAEYESHDGGIPVNMLPPSFIRDILIDQLIAQADHAQRADSWYKGPL